MAKRESVVTMSDLRAVAGMRSRQAINAWVDAGLIPPPTIVRGRSGRGRRGVWLASVLDRVRFVCAQTDQGRTLTEVREELLIREQPQPADIEKRVDRIVGRWVVRGTSRRGSKRGERTLPKDASVQDEWVAGIRVILTKDVGLSAEMARRLALRAGDRAILARALWHFEMGFEPVLMISRGCVYESTSAMVGFNHSPACLFAVMHGSGADEDHAVLGRITIQVCGLIQACLKLSGDPDDRMRLLAPVTAVDGFNAQHPSLFLRYEAKILLAKDGQIGADLRSPKMFSGSPREIARALTELRLEVEDVAKPSVIPKKTRRRTRKAVRRRG